MTKLPDTPDDLIQMMPGFLIVGLGASAGGIEALQEFFAHVSADSGIAYVVILHLSPEHESQLATILQTVTSLPVTSVAETVRVEPNHVYVVLPNQHLTMADGELTVSPNTLPEERRAPVDIFFRTLAETHHNRAVCVVLSGTGADGSMGLKRVKERGGVVFVQNPREAAFNEMPRSAIATDLVDDVLPVAAIPARILAYQLSLGAIAFPVEADHRPEQQQQALREIFTLLRVRTGHDFSNYKRPTMLRRIARRISVRNLPDLPTYAAFVRDTPDEVHALLKDLLISVTNFFRDKEAFAALEQEILPRLFQGKHADEQVRIWVVGCATGEEAYTIAMLCAERVLGVIDAPTVQIFASDIDETAIAHAREGLYTINDTADVPPEQLRRFFIQEDQRYRIRPEIREMVLFANHNVLKDPPFSHLDLVTCRNMLIYLNHSAQERVMETLHFALNPGGYLFLGTSESVDGSNDLFSPVSREQHIFQSRTSSARSLPMPDAPGWRANPARLVLPAPEPDERVRERINYDELQQRLIEQYAPPSVVVNEDYTVIRLSERAGRYLQIAGKELSNNLLQLVRPELRLELRSALYGAVQRQTNVQTGPLSVRIDERTEMLSIHVRPVLRQDDPARGFLLVVFEQGMVASNDAEPVIRTDEPVLRQLEDEVQRLKQQLRTSSEQYEYQTEELKATNEELQALNEELRSSGEELETSKEELQSINEELRTVNQELKVKVEEATLHSTNLQNLVNSTDIGTIFLDRSLRIKLFTPAARDMFNLIPADYGRPLADITHRLLDVDVLANAEIVLAKLQTIESEVHTNNGRVYLLRVLPYRAGEDRIGGVVITFFDITEHKRTEAHLRRTAELDAFRVRLHDVLRPLEDSMTIQEQMARIAMEFFGVDRCYYCEIEDGHAIIRRDASQEGLPSVVGSYALNTMPMLKAVIDAGRPFIVQDVKTTPLVDEGLRELCVRLQVISFIDVPVIKNGQPIGILCITQRTPREWADVEIELAQEIAEYTWFAVERARSETALRDSEEKFRLLIEGARDYAMFLLNPDNRITFWSVGAERLFGWTEAEALGQSGEIIFTPEDRELGAVERELRMALEEGRAEDRRWHMRKDGSRLFVDGIQLRLDDAQGKPRGFVKIGRDATAQYEIEQALQRANDELEQRVQQRTTELLRLSATRQELLQRLVTAQEDERQRIARELHDSLGQYLSALMIRFSVLERQIEHLPDAHDSVAEMRSVARQIDLELDRLTMELRPPTLDDVGLVDALASYSQEWTATSGIPIDLIPLNMPENRLPAAVETTAYRIVQEALTNVFKHAQASQVSIIVERRNTALRVVIEDDGVGFELGTHSNAGTGGRHVGLINMVERAALAGGELTIESAPGSGTTIFLNIPLSSEVLKDDATT